MNKKQVEQEIKYTFSRSSGPGGQNVNKVNSRVELRFQVFNSLVLSNIEKATILKKLSNRISESGELILHAGSSRSQLKNKESVTERFFTLLTEVLKPRKKRLKTTPTGTSVERRIKSKKMLSEKKSNRKKPSL